MDLNPETKYTALVRAVTESGLSNPPVPITISTSSLSDNSLLPQDDVYQKQKLG